MSRNAGAVADALQSRSRRNAGAASSSSLSLLANIPDSLTPASVTAVDLPLLAKLIDCDVDELTSGLHRDQSLRASGRIALPTESVAFEAEVLSNDTNASCDTALLSVASRPSVLDTAQAPKVLMTLGGEPVICHCLRQLHTGGIRHVVLVLGSRGALIRDAILAHPIAHKLSLFFLDLGEAYAGGFARSLLEARSELVQRCSPRPSSPPGGRFCSVRRITSLTRR